MIPIRLIVALFALVGVFATPGYAQRPGTDRNSIPNIGTEAFRGLFHYLKVEAVRPEQITDGDYANLIVVVLGRPQRNALDPTPYTKRALQAGGAVLIAIEDQVQLSGYFPMPTAAIITGERVTTPLDRKGAYAGLPDCPYAVPRKPGGFEKALGVIGAMDTEWGLFVGIDKLATNVPGAIEIRSESRYVRSKLAGYLPSARITTDGRLSMEPLAPDRLFAVAGSGRTELPFRELPFRSLVLSDPSVFSNQMMIPPWGLPPNNNFLFAVRVVQWLRGPTNRTKCLFIENGIPLGEFDTVRYDSLQGMPPLPIPPPIDLLKPELQRQLTDSINRGIADVQDNDSLHRRIAGTDRRYNRVLWFLATVAAMVILLVLLRRIWRGRHEPNVPPVPSDTGHVIGTAPPGSLARRREEILHSGDYSEVVREYLQDLFASNGLTFPVTKPVGKLPDVRVNGRGNTTLREYLHILWGVAFGPSLQLVTYSRWKELEPMIDFVRLAAEEGRWRFADTGETA